MTLNIDLSNYRALVTGVSSGIGAGIADVLAQAGCDIVGCGLEATTSEGAKRFFATVESHGRRAIYQSLDIADADASRSFVNWAAAQLGGLDIVVSNAGRNFIDTPLADAWFNEFPDPAAKRKQIEGLHPVGRLGKPDDVGALCAFLCSPLAGNISGNTILIDGGRSAVMQDV